MESPAAGLGPYREDVPEEFIAVVDKWQAAIAEGKISIPVMKTRDASQSTPALTLE